jgi:hypothetical protein
MKTIATAVCVIGWAVSTLICYGFAAQAQQAIQLAIQYKNLLATAQEGEGRCINDLNTVLPEAQELQALYGTSTIVAQYGRDLNISCDPTYVVTYRHLSDPRFGTIGLDSCSHPISQWEIN